MEKSPIFYSPLLLPLSNSSSPLLLLLRMTPPLPSNPSRRQAPAATSAVGEGKGDSNGPHPPSHGSGGGLKREASAGAAPRGSVGCILPCTDLAAAALPHVDLVVGGELGFGMTPAVTTSGSSGLGFGNKSGS